MGIGGIGIWQLLIILVIILLLFGTKRLRGLGGDLGGAIKGFKKAMTEDNAGKTDAADDPLDSNAPGEMKKVSGEPEQPVKPEPVKSETKQ